jgi:CubicO group peptidase (beta-lactamase class C family)
MNPMSFTLHIRSLCFVASLLWQASAFSQASEIPLPEKLHSLLIEHRGTMIRESYFKGVDKPIGDWFSKEINFTANDLHDMRSVSKTVIALAVGIAIDEGKIKGIDEPVLYKNQPRHVLGKPLTIAHLLSMSNGLQWNEQVKTYGTLNNDESYLFFLPGRANFILSKPDVAEPGSVYNYSGGNTTLLAQLIKERSGQSFPEYINERLFKPLGITEFEWRSDMLWRPVSFAGLRLKPRDLLKIGRLILQEGQWAGKQIISKQWLKQSFTSHVNINDDWQYGFHWRIGHAKWQDKTVKWVAAIGNGGQRLFIVPELELSVVMTAGDYNSADIGPKLMKVFEAVVEQTAPKLQTLQDASFLDKLRE